MNKKGLTIFFAFGRYSGFRIDRKQGNPYIRFVLGWVAITIVTLDEDWLVESLKLLKERHSENKRAK